LLLWSALCAAIVIEIAALVVWMVTGREPPLLEFASTASAFAAVGAIALLFQSAGAFARSALALGLALLLSGLAVQSFSPSRYGAAGLSLISQAFYLLCAGCLSAVWSFMRIRNEAP
jgi:hypothetical protein